LPSGTLNLVKSIDQIIDIPCIIIFVVYVIVFVEIRKLLKTRPQDKAAARSKAQRGGVSVSPYTAISMTSAAAEASTCQAPSTSKDTAFDRATPDDDKSKNTTCNLMFRFLTLIFTARRYTSAVLAVVVCPSVCLSVRLFITRSSHETTPLSWIVCRS